MNTDAPGTSDSSVSVASVGVAVVAGAAVFGSAFFGGVLRGPAATAGALGSIFFGTTRRDGGGAVALTAGGASGASLNTSQMRPTIATITTVPSTTAPRFIREKS